MADRLEPQTTLTFVADCEGDSLAVGQNTGNLYSGTVELTVNWGDTGDADYITARIISLKDVCGSIWDWFQHDSQDVGTIFLSGIDIDGSGTAEFSNAGAEAPAVRFGHRANGAEDGRLIGTATIGGKFVGNGHSEGPLGVLGKREISGTGTDAGLDFKGSFGAGLKP